MSTAEIRSLSAEQLQVLVELVASLDDVNAPVIEDGSTLSSLRRVVFKLRIEVERLVLVSNPSFFTADLVRRIVDSSDSEVNIERLMYRVVEKWKLPGRHDIAVKNLFVDVFRHAIFKAIDPNAAFGGLHTVRAGFCDSDWFTNAIGERKSTKAGAVLETFEFIGQEEDDGGEIVDSGWRHYVASGPCRFPSCTLCRREAINLMPSQIPGSVTDGNLTIEQIVCVLSDGTRTKVTNVGGRGPPKLRRSFINITGTSLTVFAANSINRKLNHTPRMMEDPVIFFRAWAAGHLDYVKCRGITQKITEKWIVEKFTYYGAWFGKLQSDSSSANAIDPTAAVRVTTAAARRVAARAAAAEEKVKEADVESIASGDNSALEGEEEKVKEADDDLIASGDNSALEGEEENVKESDVELIASGWSTTVLEGGGRGGSRGGGGRGGRGVLRSRPSSVLGSGCSGAEADFLVNAGLRRLALTAQTYGGRGVGRGSGTIGRAATLVRSGRGDSRSGRGGCSGRGALGRGRGAPGSGRSATLGRGASGGTRRILQSTEMGRGRGGGGKRSEESARDSGRGYQAFRGEGSHSNLYTPRARSNFSTSVQEVASSGARPGYARATVTPSPVIGSKRIGDSPVRPPKTKLRTHR